jgi:biopolymer transport protein ExbB/TolQ
MRSAERTCAGTVTIGEYLIGHALAAFALIESEQLTLLAERIVAWILRNRIERFSTKRCQQNLRVKSEVITAALEKLADHNFIRKVEQEQRDGPGRKPSAEWMVRPDLAVRLERIGEESASLNSRNPRCTNRAVGPDPKPHL